MVIDKLSKKISKVQKTQTMTFSPKNKRNLSYFRDESNDLDKLRLKVSRTSPKDFLLIESNDYRDIKPIIDKLEGDSTNFRSMLHKINGWFPWYKND